MMKSISLSSILIHNCLFISFYTRTLLNPVTGTRGFPE